ncbi:MAG: hypothetical protein HKP61_08605 [Dactylosporangium sp.]|nr:hypothetical protein [Dactylosporangium sp.]NNJ60995.1 hypothetical protein [Dactylosporangium sp.]
MRDREDRNPAMAVVSVAASALAATRSGTAGFDDQDVLRLRVEAALAVVPLISRVVAGRDDRRAVVVDVVDRWLGLPVGVRDRYRRIAGSAEEGLERFGWDFVDAVEQGRLPHHVGGEGAAGGPAASFESEEQIAFARWHRYLQWRTTTGDRQARWVA